MVTAGFDIDGPLDLRATLGHTGHVQRDGNVWFVANTPDGAASARFRIADGSLVVEAFGAGADYLLERAPRLAGLHDRPWEFRPDHPRLADWARRSSGLRMSAGADPVEVAMSAVFGQRVTSVEAHRSRKLFLGRYGSPAPGGCGLQAHPRAEVVATLSRDDLLAVGLDLNRARALVALAREAPRVRSLGDDVEAVSHRLLALPGIGPWTVGLVRHYAFGDAAALPLGDWHIGRDVVYALTGELHGDDRRMMELLGAYPGNEGRAWRFVMAAGVTHPRRAPGRRPNPVFGAGRVAG